MGFLDELINVGTKKDYSTKTYHSPFETYAPTTIDARQLSSNISPQYTYAVQIDSPKAEITTKKQDKLISEPESDIRPKMDITTPQTSGGQSSSGLDMMPVAIVGILAVAGIMLIKK